MDNMRISFSSPGEDEAAIAMTCLRSPIIAWAFPKREAHYDRYYTFRGVPQYEVDEWKQALVWFLKKLALKNDRPMVLKSPPHTGRIRPLLELFPDARFIHISREPYTVFRSTQRLYAKAVPLSYLQRPNLAHVDDSIIRRYVEVYDAYFEHQPLIPSGQFCDVRFEDLERDIIGQMGAIYDQLGLCGFDRLKPKLEKYASSKAGYQKNTHMPLDEPLRAKIATAWRTCFETWGYTI
jgi:hypothetical protein